jgi:hypothetical protein
MIARGFHYILLGFILVVLGAVIPFLMVLGILQLSFWLSILAYSASVIGLLIGVVGASVFAQEDLSR